MFPIQKKTSLFRTLPVRQTSYGFILVLAIVCIFKDNILIYICSNLHLCSIYLLFYLSMYISVPPRTKSWYIYICITPRTKSWTTYVSYSKKTSLFRTLPVRQTSYRFILVLAIVCIFKDNILIYICSNLHLCSIYLLFYLSIYVYICTSKDKVLVYIYMYNSKDKVLDYICFLFKKNVPVQDTACSAD